MTLKYRLVIFQINHLIRKIRQTNHLSSLVSIAGIMSLIHTIDLMSVFFSTHYDFKNRVTVRTIA